MKAGADVDGEAGLRLDAIYYVICLRNLMRAAHLVLDALHPNDFGYPEYWLRRLERTCPGVVTARNFLEHFDEYALGLGAAQRSRNVRTPLRVRLDRTPSDDWKLILVVAGRRIVIDLEGTTAAAADLWIGLTIAQDAADDLGGI
ncbi:MAG: hypothetical protein GEU94_19085, partial [Micromonosporaceae bacterium]|nr:hypothetical protein [Micromonosporaceae bacterium]